MQAPDASRLIFVDVEASALEDGFPIEVGWAVVPLRENGWRNVDSANILIQPAPYWDDYLHWDPHAQEIHGISHARLMAEGAPVDEAARIVEEALGGETVYVAGPGNYDLMWLETLFEESAIEPSFVVAPVDVLFGHLFGDSDSDSALHEAMTWYHHQVRPHRARLDALLLAEAFWGVWSAFEGWRR